MVKPQQPGCRVSMKIFVSTWHGNVRRKIKTDSLDSSHSRYYKYGALNEIQATVLFFHLLEWNGINFNIRMARVRKSLARQAFDFIPHDNGHGCIYDYLTHQISRRRSQFLVTAVMGCAPFEFIPCPGMSYLSWSGHLVAEDGTHENFKEGSLC